MDCSSTTEWECGPLEKITELLEEMNAVNMLYGIKFGQRNEYAIENLEQIPSQFLALIEFDPQTMVKKKKTLHSFNTTNGYKF